MIPSVPGQPVLDLRLAVQLLKMAAITATTAKTKNIFFICKNFNLKTFIIAIKVMQR
jgi:hypothetical protein